ncbi:hypothetical protein [Variovorax sp.]|uniref:hypothetical protein n=1 Tax=Variovorax sp. TaxID=1871043 RepID=UPI002D4C61F7|nr:hypothetical protein [Variovorax sp.]HYP82656.1 hypothetical protein [Variovorax sp.]
MTATFRTTAARRLLGMSALFLLGAAAAQAETYEGVHAPVGALSRAEVQKQGYAAARDPMWNVSSSSVVAQPLPNPTDRALVRAEAERAAANTRSGELYPFDDAGAPARSARADRTNAL